MPAVSDISAYLADNFGANATYVEGLLARFRADPRSVDESWRNYFTEMLGDTPAANGAATTAPATNGGNAAASAPSAGNGAAATTIAAPVVATTPAPAPVAAAAAVTTARAVAPVKLEGEAQPIRGAALKIVENMESSLHVPTATSVRRVPVKVLEENRRILNAHLAQRGAGKASFTHLIAWACVQALQKYPNLNDGFTEQEGTIAMLHNKRVPPSLGFLAGGFESLPKPLSREQLKAPKLAITSVWQKTVSSLWA